jgi:hypothetical protein
MIAVRGRTAANVARRTVPVGSESTDEGRNRPSGVAWKAVNRALTHARSIVVNSKPGTNNQAPTSARTSAYANARIRLCKRPHPLRVARNPYRVRGHKPVEKRGDRTDPCHRNASSTGASDLGVTRGLETFSR